jgi:hypothetical protein
MNAFRSILSIPGSAAMTAAGFVGRFPMGMVGLAVTMLVVAQTGSYGLAGAIAAAVTLSAAVGGPLGARLADQYGQHRVVPPLILVNTLALAGLTWAVMAGWPRLLWFALAAVQGLTGPNIGAMVRSRWARLVSNPAQLNTAFALESTLDEVAFVIGPPLATLLAVAVAPWSAVATGILLSLAGSLGLAAQRRTEPPAAPRGHGATGRSWSAVMVVVVGLMFLMGGIFGALEVATVAFALERGAPGTTGWYLGAFALASMATGLFLGMRELTWGLSHQIIAGAAMLAASTSALPFITTSWLFGLGMFATGLGCSAVLIGGMQLVERSQPANRLTESLAIAVSGIMVGSAAAVAVAGAAIDAAGAAAGMAVAAGAALLGLVLAAGTRPVLGRRLARHADPDGQFPAMQPSPAGAQGTEAGSPQALA